MKLNQGETSDAVLVEQYLTGRTAAIETLVNRHRDRLYVFILNMVRSPAEADDVFQDTWLRAIRAMEGYRERNFGAWLARIARNLIIDRWRARKEMVSLDAEGAENAVADELPAGTMDPARHAESSDMKALVAGAIDKLPAEQKEVVLLRLEAELSFREIAAIQDVSINTALARMQYGLSKLRGMLRAAR